ncbi:MAG: hypothetical protein QGI60_03685 [archaeon]|jgi:His-Xaa-Ser system protein HxsD|nr:hypothetical protein [archaeon]
MSNTGNIEINGKENFALVSVNAKIYSLAVVFSAAYVMLEKAFVVIDGDPKEQIVVSLEPKNGRDVKELAQEFNEQLVNFAVNIEQSQATKAVREEFIKQAFITHSRK